MAAIEGEEALLNPEAGYKTHARPSHICVHGEAKSICGICDGAASEAMCERFGADEWNLMFDPLLARSLGRLSNEVYNNFVTGTCT